MTRNIQRAKYAVLPLLALLAIAAPGARVAQAESAPGVQMTVPMSVEETIAKLSKMVADNGMMVMGELHQGKVLAMTGMKVKSESIFVGNPTVGKKLFSLDRSAGLAVPFRINVFENEKGQTVVCYLQPSSILGQYDNPEIDEVAAMLDKKFEGLTSMLAK